MSYLSLPAALALALLLVGTPSLIEAQIRDGRLPRTGRVILDRQQSERHSDDDSDSDSDSDSDADSDSDSDSDRRNSRREQRDNGRSRAGDICLDRNRDGICDSTDRRRDRRRRDDTCIDQDRDGRCDTGISRRRIEDILGSVIRGGQYVTALARRMP